MYEPPIMFTATYPEGLVRQAARAFRNYQFKRYGPLLIVACVVNALSPLLCLRLGVKPGVALNVVIFVALLGPTWLLYRYFVAPATHAASLRRVLPAQGSVSLSAASVSLEVRGKQVEVPWSAVKAVVETNTLFLLVLSPFAFTFLPRIGMPFEADKSLLARSRCRVA
jgi:hypothetical protein